MFWLTIILNISDWIISEGDKYEKKASKVPIAWGKKTGHSRCWFYSNINGISISSTSSQMKKANTATSARSREREERVSDFIAAFISPPLLSPAELADVIRQQEVNLNVPIIGTWCTQEVRGRLYLACSQPGSLYWACSVAYRHEMKHTETIGLGIVNNLTIRFRFQFRFFWSQYNSISIWLLLIIDLNASISIQ